MLLVMDYVDLDMIYLVLKTRSLLHTVFRQPSPDRHLKVSVLVGCAVFFEIKLNVVLENLILWIHLLILCINSLWGDLTDISAHKASLLVGSATWWMGLFMEVSEKERMANCSNKFPGWLNLISPLKNNLFFSLDSFETMSGSASVFKLK